MSKKFLTILIAAAAMLFIGCDNDDDVVVIDFAPAAPQGVYSVTGDNAVYVYFNGPYESDIDGYIIWRSLEEFTNYQDIGWVDAVANPNLDLLIYEYVDASARNGVTYFYAVSSVDEAGQVSELSAESVFDTPRPEGRVELFDSSFSMNAAAFDFNYRVRVSALNEAADVVVDRDGFGFFYINAADILTDIQDVGYTDSFDEVGWSPVDGWSDIGFMEIIEGHTYVIWTNDNHFAKMRVLAVGSNSVVFEWAYQTDEGNPELKPVVPTAVKPEHGPDYLIKNF